MSKLRIAVVEGEQQAAEKLHTFFHVMECDSALIDADERAVDTVRRLSPDVVLLDCDAPALHAVEAARRLAAALSGVQIIYTSAFPQTLDHPVVRKPFRQFEEMLALLEMMLR